MRWVLAALAASACGSAATSAHIDNVAKPGRSSDPGLGVVFVPATHGGVLDSLAMPRADGPHRYDLDGDGTADLVMEEGWFYGPSKGFTVSIRRGTQMEQVVAATGDFADERRDGDIISLRYGIPMLAEGEARYSVLLRYDLAKHAWDEPVATYHASQGELPIEAMPPFLAIATTVRMTMRAAPVVDDALHAQGSEQDQFSRSSTLVGNVIARYPAGEAGLVVATKGDWRFVAMKPDASPTDISLQHGMSLGQPSPWICGWVRADELTAASAR